MKKISFLFLSLFLFSFSNTAFAEVKDSYQTTDLRVQWVSQAPLGNWRDARFADGCEETSVIMAGYWAKGESFSNLTAQNIIKSLAAYEKRTWGFHQDTSAKDTAKLLAYYFKIPSTVHYNITTADIRDALDNGNLVIVPINGTKLDLYGRRTIQRHTVVVTGFNPDTNVFTINDPLAGGGIKVPGPVLESALRDYPSGIHRVVRTLRTAMIIVQKS